MSIVDKTIKHLVRNRVHELSDHVIEINGRKGWFAALEVLPNEVTVDLDRATSRVTLTCALPGNDVSDQESLTEIESVLAAVQRFARGDK